MNNISIESSAFLFWHEKYFCKIWKISEGNRQRMDMFEEYHTSEDNLSFMNKECLADSFFKYLSVIQKLEGYLNYVKPEKITLVYWRPKFMTSLVDPIIAKISAA